MVHGLGRFESFLVLFRPRHVTSALDTLDDVLVLVFSLFRSSLLARLSLPGNTFAVLTVSDQKQVLRHVCRKQRGSSSKPLLQERRVKV